VRRPRKRRQKTAPATPRAANQPEVRSFLQVFGRVLVGMLEHIEHQIPVAAR
jgi:hypothetical protein